MRPVTLTCVTALICRSRSCKLCHHSFRQPVGQITAANSPPRCSKSGSGSACLMLSRIIIKVPVPYFSMYLVRKNASQRRWFRGSEPGAGRVLRREFRRQHARIPDLHAVGKDGNLHGSRRCVISVRTAFTIASRTTLGGTSKAAGACALKSRVPMLRLSTENTKSVARLTCSKSRPRKSGNSGLAVGFPCRESACSGPRRTRRTAADRGRIAAWRL